MAISCIMTVNLSWQSHFLFDAAGSDLLDLGGNWKWLYFWVLNNRHTMTYLRMVFDKSSWIICFLAGASLHMTHNPYSHDILHISKPIQHDYWKHLLCRRRFHGLIILSVFLYWKDSDMSLPLSHFGCSGASVLIHYSS